MTLRLWLLITPPPPPTWHTASAFPSLRYVIYEVSGLVKFSCVMESKICLLFKSVCWAIFELLLLLLFPPWRKKGFNPFKGFLQSSILKHPPPKKKGWNMAQNGEALTQTIWELSDKKVESKATWNYIQWKTNLEFANTRVLSLHLTKECSQ